MTAPSPLCTYCRGAGEVLACPPGSTTGVRVRCVCTQRTRADRLIRLIRLHQQQHGYPPTLRELAAAAGLAPSTINEHIHRLVWRGRLRPANGQARSIGVPP